MKTSTETKILEALERIVARLDRLVPVEPVVPSTPSKPPVPMRDRVSLIARGRSEPETSMGHLTQGGTSPEEFWSRPDPYRHELERPIRRRRMPVTR